PDIVFLFATPVAFADSPYADWIRHDGSDGCNEHSFAGHGSRSPARARDVTLLYDVYRHGSYWGVGRRRARGENRRGMDRIHWWTRLPCGRRHLREALARHARCGAAIDPGPRDGHRRTSGVFAGFALVGRNDLTRGPWAQSNSTPKNSVTRSTSHADWNNRPRENGREHGPPPAAGQTSVHRLRPASGERQEGVR